MNRRSLIQRIACGVATGIAARHVVASASGSNAEDLAQPPVHQIGRVHQTLIVDGFALPQVLPEMLASNVAQLQSLYPGAKYRLWSGEAIRTLIDERFGREVVGAFDCLKPYAFKSDLARYCVLHAQGGLYSDLSLVHRTAWKVPTACGFAAFMEAWADSVNPRSLCNSLLFAEPERREFEIAILQIVQHCRRRFYGTCAVMPTGPWLLASASAAAATDAWRAGRDDAQHIGVAVYPGDALAGYLGVNAAYVSHRSHPHAVALRLRRDPADWSRFPVKGVNNYRQMWASGEVYGEHVLWPKASSAHP